MSDANRVLRVRHAPAAPVESPTVAIAIPVLNGGERLLRAVESCVQQRDCGTVEILLADSGSKDGAAEEILRRWPSSRVWDVPPGRFDHGAVRTALVLEARAPMVALLTQDAVPQGDGYLRTLLDAFTDPEIAGVYARQVPRPDADPLVHGVLRRWTPPPSALKAGDQPVVQRLEDDRWVELSPREQMKRARFDNVGSMVRRGVLAKLPFPSRPFGEDLSWGAAALRGGLWLAYAPAAVIEHHHHPSLRESFQRNRVAHRQAAGEFGLRAVPDLRSAATALVKGIPGDLRDGGPRWAVRGMPRRAASLLGQWAGGREPVR